MKQERTVDIAIIGAGVAGVATAYYLCTRFGISSLLLIDPQSPMSYTSAQSGDNYRNWWPEPVMGAFTNHSIDLMEEIARESENPFNMTRRGYVLATRRSDVDDLLAELDSAGPVRRRDAKSATTYIESLTDDWRAAPDGVDVIEDPQLIHRAFPGLTSDIRRLIHIRRAGDFDSQQLAAFMLEQIRAHGGRVLRGRVRSVVKHSRFALEIETPQETPNVRAECLINAAGPFAAGIARMLGVELPIENTFQQKIAFGDTLGAVPRDLPFVIDLDPLTLEWPDEIAGLLAENEDTAWLAQSLPGGRHCRPDGAREGSRVKLGWAYNREPSEPQVDFASEPGLDEHFPEIVIRGLASLLPALAVYIEAPPARFSHYGGYYTMTRENWPLIGPLGVDGAFTVSALSGFGSMAACAAGWTCAAWVSAYELPSYAHELSLARYADTQRIEALCERANKGLL